MTARALRAQTKLELFLTLRRGEAVLLTLIIPVGLLVFFGTTELFAVTVEFITPGLLALAVLSSSLVSLAIATGYERKYLVLKRLGATPLPRSVLFGAKAISVLVLEILQVALLLGVAAGFFDWRARAALDRARARRLVAAGRSPPAGHGSLLRPGDADGR